MKILVDTSVWSLAIRRKSPSSAPEVTRLTEFINQGETIFLSGVILTEVLQGIGNYDQFVRVRRHLEPFPLLELNREGFVKAAQLGSHCRSKGVQSSTADILIAQTAIEFECCLLTADQDFSHIARHSQLKLA